MSLFDVLDVNLKVENPWAHYIIGSGDSPSNARHIFCSWYLTIYDVNRHPVTMTFNLVDGQSPLIVRMDIRNFSDTCNRTWPPTIMFKGPGDVRDYTFHTYIVGDNCGDPTMMLYLVSHEHIPLKSLRDIITHGFPIKQERNQRGKACSKV